ncbi:MAG: tetratricopeptide repeat protein, partial [Bacteroidia bacterium]|nr:tetratricopeptide repeat protein [Bacteroidia bacterium]
MSKSKRPKISKKDRQAKRPTSDSIKSSPSNKSTSNKKLSFTLSIIVAALAFLLYVNTYNHEYALDDFPTIYGNSLTMQGFDGIPTMLKTAYWYGLDGKNDFLYRPLSLITFAVEWEFFPDTPAVGHVTNGLLYVLLAFLVFITLKDLLKKYNIVIPFITTLLFVAHPIHTEVVANIKSRDELLCMIFCVLSLFYAVKHFDKPDVKHLVLIFVFFFLGLFSKESAITYLAVVPLALYFFRKTDFKKIAIPSGVAIASAALYLFIRGQILTSQTVAGEIALIDNTLIAAPNYMGQLATAFYILGLYIKLLFFPHPLSSDYSFAQIPIVDFSNPIALVSIFFHVALAVYAVVRITKKDPIAFSIIYYAATISLVSNILFLTRSTMADRFLFIPSLGFALIIAMLLHKYLTKENAQATYKSFKYFFQANKNLLIVTAVITALFGFKTIERNGDWKNDYSIFSHDSKVTTNSSRLKFLYANHLIQSLNQNKVPAEKQDEYWNTAVEEFKKCVEIHPQYFEAYFGLGEAYNKKGDYAKAVEYYQKVLEIKPTYRSGLNNLGNAYLRAGNMDKAIETFNKAISLHPDYPEAYNNMGTVYFTIQNYGEALRLYQKCIEINPDYFDGLKNLGSAYGSLQQYDNSIDAFMRALKQQPNNAEILYFIGVTYQLKGDQANANNYLNRAYAINPA